MNAPFQFTPQTTEDLNAIWWFIAKDNRDAADRVEMEIIATCRRLAKHPLMGTRRQDITPLAVRFWTLPKFSNYVIVYRADNAFPALDEKAAAKLKDSSSTQPPQFGRLIEQPRFENARNNDRIAGAADKTFPA